MGNLQNHMSTENAGPRKMTDANKNTAIVLKRDVGKMWMYWLYSHRTMSILILKTKKFFPYQFRCLHATQKLGCLHGT